MTKVVDKKYLCDINLYMADTIIIPIFDQSAPGIWNDFACVRATAIREKYGYTPPASDNDAQVAAFQSMWRSRRGFNFAFAAYQNGHMIGFAQGTRVGGHAKLHNLYVTSAADGMHMGRVLLSRAEQAASLGAKSMEIVAMGGAMNFYRNQGYIPQESGSNHFNKPIKVPPYAVIPVFGVTAQLMRKYPQINEHINMQRVVYNHRPAFICTDGDGVPVGFATCESDIVASNVVVYEKLERELHKMKMAPGNTR